MQTKQDKINQVSYETKIQTKENQPNQMTRIKKPDGPTFKIKFLTKEETLFFSEYDTIESLKRYISQKYDIRTFEQVIMFKGVKLKHLDKLTDLRANEDDVCLHLVVERKPLDLCIRMGSFDSPVQTISITASHTNTIKEVTQKITDATKIPIKYLNLEVKMNSSDEGKHEIVSLDEEDKLVQDYFNQDGTCPVFRIKQLINARLHCVPISNKIVNYYELVEDDSLETIEDLLARIRTKHDLKEWNLSDVRDTRTRNKLKRKTLLRSVFKINITVDEAGGPPCCGCFG